MMNGKLKQMGKKEVVHASSLLSGYLQGHLDLWQLQLELQFYLNIDTSDNSAHYRGNLV
jgi:hypothetical protein